jgi:AraC-like DNA-binding protein
MADPLSQVIELLRPRAIFSKAISGAGRWAVRYTEFGQPGFCAMVEGRCRLAVDDEAPVVLEEGDFVLLPATPAFTMSSLDPARPTVLDPRQAAADAEVRYGRQDGPPDVRQFGGYFAFGSPDAALLVSLLPRMIHVRCVPRLSQLVRLLGEEAAREEIGRSLILARLVDVLLVEALRAVPGDSASPGLLHGLADPRVAAALRRIHGDPERPWTVADLAREAGMSRSAFFERFARTVGVRPMEYLLAWRMAVAKDLLRTGGIALDDVARRIGYGSQSTFSTAFSRHVGMPPGRFMRSARALAEARH